MKSAFFQIQKPDRRLLEGFRDHRLLVEKDLNNANPQESKPRKSDILSLGAVAFAFFKISPALAFSGASVELIFTDGFVVLFIGF